MDLPTRRRYAGIPGDDFDTALHGFFQYRDHGIRIVGGDSDRIHSLGDQSVQHFDLRFCRGGGWAGINHFHIA